MMYAVKKGVKKQLSPHVNSSELDCKCKNIHCCWTIFSHDLLEKFEELRTSCGNRPLHITSAMRCVDHNFRVGGLKSSKHLLGLAIDVACPDHLEFDEFFYRASQVEFDMVIPYKENNFIHVHLNPRSK